MRLKKVIAVEDAVAIVRDGDVIASTGYGGNGTPDELFVALEQRYLQTGTPRDLTLVFAGGQGDGAEKGLNHLGHEGLVRRVVGGHFGLTPRIGVRRDDQVFDNFLFRWLQQRIVDLHALEVALGRKRNRDDATARGPLDLDLVELRLHGLHLRL